jgi:CBS domain-containing protein
MSPAEFVVAPEMILRRATEVLVACREEGVPVVDAAGDFVGEISARMLIEIGLPKYMNLISNPRILSDFQPFEAFYRKEDTLTADEVVNRDVLTLAPETPVEIVAHEMITKRNQRAYVVREKKLLGVIYRRDIVRKVLYL